MLGFTPKLTPPHPHHPCLCLGLGDSGLLVCRLDNSDLATEKESQLLLYQHLDLDLDNLSCSERLAKAQFTSKDEDQPGRLSHLIFSNFPIIISVLLLSDC